MNKTIMKKLYLSLLISLLMIGSLCYPYQLQAQGSSDYGFIVTEEEDRARIVYEQALSEAQAAEQVRNASAEALSTIQAQAQARASENIAKAKQAVADAKQALKTAQDTIKEGSLGFFKWHDTGRHSVEAMEEALALQAQGLDPTGDPIAEAAKTRLGEDTDATGLQHMRDSIAYLKKGNQLRKKEGSSALKVTDYLMAIQQIKTNASAYYVNHTHWYGAGENLMFDTYYEDPYYYWYNVEKSVYDYKQSHPDATNEQIAAALGYELNLIQTGHYLNLINKPYQYTGFAINTEPEDHPYINVWGQAFSSYKYDPDKAYTVDQYEADFETYYVKIYDDVDAANEQIKAAKEYLADLQKNNGISPEDRQAIAAAQSQLSQDEAVYQQKLSIANAALAAYERLIITDADVTNRKTAYLVGEISDPSTLSVRLIHKDGSTEKAALGTYAWDIEIPESLSFGEVYSIYCGNPDLHDYTVTCMGKDFTLSYQLKLRDHLMTYGNRQTVNKDSTGSVRFVSDAQKHRFLAVLFDDIAISQAYYSVRGQDKTELIFDHSVFDGLVSGVHRITIVSDDGCCTGYFYVTEGTDQAYAILTEEGTLTFFRSEGSYGNGETGTIVLNGRTFEGTVFSGFETETYDEENAAPWQGYSLQHVTVADGCSIRPVSTAYWFVGQTDLLTGDFDGFDTAETSDMKHMFEGCLSLISLDIDCFVTSYHTDLEQMFLSCDSLISLNLGPSFLRMNQDVCLPEGTWTHGSLSMDQDELMNSYSSHAFEWAGRWTRVSDYVRIYDRSRQIESFKTADELKKVLGKEKFSAIVIAKDSDFADALSGSYLAARKEAPILLIGNGDYKDTFDYIENNLQDGGTVYILGSENAVPSAFEKGLDRSVRVKRLAGSSRFMTNLEVLKEAGMTSSGDIFVVTGSNFADSLSSGAVGLPILMVDNKNTTLKKSQITFLQNNVKGIIYILGDENAVNKSLASALKAYGKVKRIGGTSRWDTTAKIASRFFSNPDCIVLATGNDFADGLIASPLAYALHSPLLLCASNKTSWAKNYVSDKNVSKAYIIGSKEYVSDAAVRKILLIGNSVVITER